MATAIEIRTVGLQLEAAVGELKTAVDALDASMSAWDLRGLDGALPADTDMKTALDAYDAISKQSLSLNDDLSAVRAVVIP